MGMKRHWVSVALWYHVLFEFVVKTVVPPGMCKPVCNFDAQLCMHALV